MWGNGIVYWTTRQECERTWHWERAAAIIIQRQVLSIYRMLNDFLTYDFIKQQKSNHLVVAVSEQSERKRYQCLATISILRHPMPNLTSKSYAIFWRKRILKESCHSFMIRAKVSLMTFRVKQKSKQITREPSKSFILLLVICHCLVLTAIVILVIVRNPGTRNSWIWKLLVNHQPSEREQEDEDEECIVAEEMEGNNYVV